MVSITVQLNFDYALSFRFFLLWQPLVETGARSQLMLVAWSRRVEGLVPALATIGVAISLCPKVPLRGYERWGLTMLLLIFT